MTDKHHVIEFTPGFDCIKFECKFGSERCRPGSGGTHGKHGLEIRFIVKGDAGAIQFVLSTGWLPQMVQPDRIGYRAVESWGTALYPSDLGYHAKALQYDGQEPITDSCKYLDGAPCYYDGSTLNAYDAMYALVNGGDKALWEFLDAVYYHRFCGGEYPQPAEYPMPMRETEGEYD